ncbi:MAG TPA: hypothetical protein VMB82_03470 [Acidimicrobiales bacterium]|nr:hypothetical protein [Acidimicrobiales bacterium]
MGGGLSPALDGIRLSLHVLAATIWVGGQLTLAGLIGTARGLGEGAPQALARAFARVQWPAYVVLVITGLWNVSATHAGQPRSWQVVLGIKIAVVALAGVGAYLHSRARSRRGLAVWGAVSALSSVTALVMGVFLAG